jgi:hypothetical protein
MKRCVFWDITLCSPLTVNGRFGGTCRLHLQPFSFMNWNRVLCCVCVCKAPLSVCDTVLCQCLGFSHRLQRSRGNNSFRSRQTSNQTPRQEELRANRNGKTKTVPRGTLRGLGPIRRRMGWVLALRVETFRFK